MNFDLGPESLISSTAIWVLGRYDDDRAIQALEAVMNSPSENTRLDVAGSFGESPHKSAIKLLLKMQDDSFWWVRKRVAQELNGVNTKESLAALHKFLKDESEDVRNAAKETLKSIGH